jgi:hypothetical protein
MQERQNSTPELRRIHDAYIDGKDQTTMPEFPDVSCLIKVINSDGKRVKDGGLIWAGTATVRYVIFNDSHQTAGPLMIVGTLSRDGVPVKPNGKPVVPAQLITLQPDQIWTSEFEVTQNDFAAGYVAKMLGDVGNLVDEEDEANNKAKTTFGMAGNP